MQWPAPRRVAPVAPRRRAATTCASPPSRTPASRAAIDSLVRRAGLDRAEPRRPRRAARHAPRLPDLAERRRARSPRSSTQLARARPRRADAVARSRANDAPIARWLDPARLPRRAPAARARWARRRASCTPRSTRTRAQTACRGSTPSAARSSATCSARRSVVAWQEAKAAFLARRRRRWSELPHLYARYGTPGTARADRRAARARGRARARSSPTAACRRSRSSPTCCSRPARHAVADAAGLQQDAQRSSSAARERVGADGHDRRRRRPRRARRRDPPRDAPRVRRDVHEPARCARRTSRRSSRDRAPRPGARLVIDSTIATPWAFRTPLLAQGVDVVIGSLTKALGGQDAALGGYIATNDAELGNQIMDLIAMRGGILDDDRARRVVGRPRRRRAHARAPLRDRRPGRRASSRAHPRGRARVPPVAARSPRRRGDRARLRAHRLAALVPRRAAPTRPRHRHIADVLVVVRRPALRAVVRRPRHQGQPPPHRLGVLHARRRASRALGIDRLIRLGIGLEDADDLIACLNWTLHHEARGHDRRPRRVARRAGGIARAARVRILRARRANPRPAHGRPGGAVLADRLAPCATSPSSRRPSR